MEEQEEYEEQAQTLARWRRQLDLARALIHSGYTVQGLAVIADVRADMHLAQILGLPAS